MAAVLRLWMLPSLPLGLHYDEAANVILTRQIAWEGYRPLFIRPYTGKEVLFFYLSAPWVAITDGDPWGVRLSAAMIGILTVAATYAMTRGLLPQHRHQRTALYAAAWMAVTFPHLVLSRYGFRAISQPLMQALTVVALWRGLQMRKVGWLAAGGGLLGLTAYTYLAARLFPIPLGIALLVLWFRAPSRDRQQLTRALSLIFLCAAITFSPLGLFFLRNPETFTTRITQVASPTLTSALQGIWACLKALGLPGAGDPYIRFNQPGTPLLDLVSAVLAGIGVVVLLRATRTNALTRSGHVLVLTTVMVMLLPSALATGEITPSNLRMVGVFPFLALLPALGLAWLVQQPGLRRFRSWVPLLLFLALFAGAGTTYARWSHGSGLFYAADGEMVLASQAVDAQMREGMTLYIASEHYKHPTVAALSPHYKRVKWLTGGASFVLPPEGDAVVLVPSSLQPSLAWPDDIASHIIETRIEAPDGSPALSVQRLSAGDMATIKQASALITAEPASDFAHITAVHHVAPGEECQVGAPCTVLLVWEVLSTTPNLQPMVRVTHPTTGEWARAMPFHYPAEQWTPGDIILDQIQLDLPQGMPPGDAYQLAVSMVDTADQQLLPRLVDEQFAGLAYAVRASGRMPWPAPPSAPFTEADLAKACPGVTRTSPVNLDALRLLGWLFPTQPAGTTPLPFSPGDLLLVTLCWEVLANADDLASITFELESPTGTAVLYRGAPAQGYEFAAWLPGTAVEDRYALRIPRDREAGLQSLQLHIDNAPAVALAQVEIHPLTRSYVLPEVAVTVDAVFESQSGERQLRLWGYDAVLDPESSTLALTLTWQSIQPVEQDYVIFLHLVDRITGEPVSQIDEQPQQGARSTSTWAEGEVISDTHILDLPDGREALLAGDYDLRLGLYLPLSGSYLHVNGERDLILHIKGATGE